MSLLDLVVGYVCPSPSIKSGPIRAQELEHSAVLRSLRCDFPYVHRLVVRTRVTGDIWIRCIHYPVIRNVDRFLPALSVRINFPDYLVSREIEKLIDRDLQTWSSRWKRAARGATQLAPVLEQFFLDESKERQFCWSSTAQKTGMQKVISMFRRKFHPMDDDSSFFEPTIAKETHRKHFQLLITAHLGEIGMNYPSITRRHMIFLEEWLASMISSGQGVHVPLSSGVMTDADVCFDAFPEADKPFDYLYPAEWIDGGKSLGSGIEYLPGRRERARSRHYNGGSIHDCITL